MTVEGAPLYGIWSEVKHAPTGWWYMNDTPWFTHHLRVARAQYNLLMAKYEHIIDSLKICQLGPKGEPIELDTRGE